jgi:CubicO group peptidase (beta-lactamase class C family)
MLRLITRQHGLNFALGSEYDYTNSGYLLLAEVVARATGQSFADWMRHHVFDPLGMTHTFVNDDYGRVIPGRARSYAFSAEGMRELTLTTASTGATGVVSTAEDLVKWLDNWRTARVGGPAVRAMMLRRGVLANGDSIRYALGVNIRTFHGLQRVDHGGYQAGFRTMLVYYPELEAGIVLLGNTPGFRETTLADRVSEIFFESEFRPVPLPTAIASSPAVDRPPTAWQPDSVALSRYAGTYYSPELEAAYTLLVSEGRLWARHRRHGDIPFVAEALDHFTSPRWMFGRVGFQRDRDGAVIRMVVTPSNERVRGLVFDRVALPISQDSPLE